MAATAGKVALVNATTAPSDACPSDGTIVDLVGYGSTANCFRGSAPAAAPSNTTSVLRNSDGCTDTQNNANDFAVGAPNPRNTASTTNQCGATIFSALISEAYHNHWRDLLALLFDRAALPHRNTDWLLN